LFVKLLDTLRQTEWVVFAKPPFGGPEQVLKYLARYTHRIAISNHRLIKMEDGKIYFHWKDYAHGSVQKTMALDAVEFIRRFLQVVFHRYKSLQKLRFFEEDFIGSAEPTKTWRLQNEALSIKSEERNRGSSDYGD
jgi:Putative transposase